LGHNFAIAGLENSSQPSPSVPGHTSAKILSYASDG